MKKLISLFLAFVLCFAMSACGNSSAKGEAEKNIEYSNLTKEKSCKELRSALLDAGVKEKNVDIVMSSVKEYNHIVGNKYLKNKATTSFKKPFPKYDYAQIVTKWDEKNSLFVGFNSRITAFELMKDFITINDKSSTNPADLFVDEDALENSKTKYFSQDELLNFEVMYSTIPTVYSTDLNKQYEVQQAYWQKIGLKFAKNPNLSLISVYVCSTDGEKSVLNVGHTGVLIKTQDGYLFFEKLSFQLPYQMVKFENKEDVKKYLSAIYDGKEDGDLKALILENEKMM